jgi:signal transduction histidine kinase
VRLESDEIQKLPWRLSVSGPTDYPLSGCQVHQRGPSARIGITATLLLIVLAGVAFVSPQSISTQVQQPIRHAVLSNDFGDMVLPGMTVANQAVVEALERSPYQIWISAATLGARLFPDEASRREIRSIGWKAWSRSGFRENNLLASGTVLYRGWSIWQRTKSIRISDLLIILSLSALVAYLLFSRKELRLAKDAQTQLTGRLIDAQEKERSRLAAELHDDFSQRLALLALGLETVSEDLPDSPLSAKHKLQELMNSASELGADIHTVSHRLHSATLESLGLEPGIRYLCKEFTDRQGIEIDFSADNIPRVVDPSVALCLFRIVQEALQNLRKHSGAARAEVRLNKHADKIFVSVYDQGKGFNVNDTKAHEGLGIRSMGERARLLSGRFEIHSKPGRGTRVEAAIPLRTAIGNAQD